jgi:transketolase
MTYELLVAAKLLEEKGISAEVVHVPTIKPLDDKTIIASIRKTGRALTAEAAQMAGGFGGSVAELLGDQLPTPLLRIGMKDRFGESGEPRELLQEFGLDGKSIAHEAREFINHTPKYHQGF